MRKTATIAASILLAFSAIAAATSEQFSKKPVSVEYDGPVSTRPMSVAYDGPVAGAAEAHDYKLERESCCGPQQ